MDYEPLPLIERLDIIPGEEVTKTKWSLKTYGYLLLLLTWLLCIVSINSFFKVWKFIIYPLSLNEATQDQYSSLKCIFEYLDDFILNGWCIYVMLWWWSLVSWCSLSLFRHSKGLQR